MILRGYQTRCIEAARARFVAGARRVLIVSPTGSGKSTMGSAIARGHVEQGGRVLWLAHRSELISQAAETLRRMGLDVGVIRAGEDWSGTAQVVVASVHTLLASGAAPLASLVIVDEAHHYVDEWALVLEPYAACPLIGLTATPERADGRALAWFQALVVAATIRELTAGGHLVPLEILAPSRLLRPGTLCARPVDAYLAHAPGERAVVFASRVAEAEAFAEEFRARAVDARVVHGEMNEADRAAALRGQVIVNVAVLTEGWDAPDVSCCILARGCGSEGLLIQMVGRVLRPSAGKKRALLLDLRGVTCELGDPTEDRVYALTGRGIRRVDEARERFCIVCGFELAATDAVCPECGREPETPKPVRIVKDPLVAYAGKRREDDEKRIATMARWIREGWSKGYKPGFAFGRYRAVYGTAPTKEITAAAMAAAKGKAA